MTANVPARPNYDYSSTPVSSSSVATSLSTTKSVRFMPDNDLETMLDRALPSPTEASGYSLPSAPSEAMFAILHRPWKTLLSSLSMEELEKGGVVDEKVRWIRIGWDVTGEQVLVERDRMSEFITVERVIRLLQTFLEEEVMLSNPEIDICDEEVKKRASEEAKKRLGEEGAVIDSIRREDFISGKALRDIEIEPSDKSWRLVFGSA